LPLFDREMAMDVVDQSLAYAKSKPPAKPVA